jgi:hypothetical protein
MRRLPVDWLDLETAMTLDADMPDGPQMFYLDLNFCNLTPTPNEP